MRSFPRSFSNVLALALGATFAGVALAQPHTNANAAPRVERLEAHGLSIAVPRGWSVHRVDDGVVAESPDKRAGLYFYAVNSVAGSLGAYHAAEGTFGVDFPLAPAGKPTTVHGLSFLVASAASKRSVTMVMLGTSPRVASGASGLFAFYDPDVAADRTGVEAAAASITSF